MFTKYKNFHINIMKITENINLESTILFTNWKVLVFSVYWLVAIVVIGDFLDEYIKENNI